MSGRQYMSHRAGTIKAGADLSAATLRYTFVKIVAAGGTTAVAAEFPIAVQQNMPKSGGALQLALVDGGGSSKLRAHAAIAVGDKLNVAAAGRAITTTTAGDEYFAVAKEAATAKDEIIEAFLCRGQVGT